MVTTSVSAATKLLTTEKLKAGSVTCEFVMPGCQHEQIFHEEYLRTNRTSHTKIMRCFPHCCPGHRPRSYCGAPLHVKIKSSSPKTDDQLVVFGRFRPVHLPALRIEERVPVAAIETSLQRVDPSNGDWVDSKVSRHETEPLLFVIAPHDHWFYPWSGAATVAMRATHHVFEAVVFCRVSETELQVVATTSSPKFRLKSYRRSGAKPVDPMDDDGVSPRTSPKRKAATRAASPTQEQSSSERSSISLSESSILRHSQENQWSQLQEQRIATSAPPQLEAHNALPPPALTMDGLMSWLHDVPANRAGSQLLVAWQNTVLNACEAHKAATYDNSGTRSSLVPILSALDIMEAPVSAYVSPPSPSSAPSSPLDTIDAAVRVLLNEWLDLNSVRASTSAVERVLRGGCPLSRGGLAVAHGEWLATTTQRAQRLVHQHTSTSWPQLRDAAMGSHGQHLSSSHTNEFSCRAFVAKIRERLLHQHKWRPNAENVHKRQRPSHAATTDVHDGHLLSAPVWISRMEDVAIDMSGMSQNGVSLLTVIQFWKHLSCLRLDFSPTSTEPSGPSAHLSVASVFNSLVSDGCFTKLTLDGQYRWFNCLPSGEPTIGTTLMGYVVGDYVGRATSTGTIHITTYMWPTGNSVAATATAFAWHWTLDGASLSLSTDGVSSTVVSVVVESAWVRGSRHAMETMSMAEKLRCVGRWQHACELRYVYRIE